MKCIDCENMKIFSIEDGCGSSAKCLKTSKQGKQIYWAMTTPNEDGKDRVVTALSKKENAPHWCPLKKLVHNKYFYSVEMIKKDEIIDFNGFKFKCLIEQLPLPKIISKPYLLWLCGKGKLEELK